MLVGLRALEQSGALFSVYGAYAKKKGPDTQGPFFLCERVAEVSYFFAAGFAAFFAGAFAFGADLAAAGAATGAAFNAVR